MTRDSNDTSKPDMDPNSSTRREFLTRLTKTAALTAFGISSVTMTQAEETITSEAIPAVPDTAAIPPPDVPGTIPNLTILAEKDSVLAVHTERPLTASVTAEHLHDYVTPTNRMFVRNNLLVPDINGRDHHLLVTGLVTKPLNLTMRQLRRLDSVKIHAMLECAGAGRTAYQPTPRGTPWPATGGMGCPQWTGVPLRDVLDLAGMVKGGKHVAFICADFGALATAPPFVRSIPIEKALEENTLLAWGMNGAPLTKTHGFPVRVLVPGWAGSASAKWVKEIRVLPEPFKGTYMDDSYRLPRYPVAPGDPMPADSVSAEASPVKSIITSPLPSTRFKLGDRIVFEGKAWSGENRVKKVEISFDEGLTWWRAWLGSRGDKYAWRTFAYEWEADQLGYISCIARAIDKNDNMQPLVATWNPLGYFWNGAHRVGIVVEKA